MYFDPKYLVSLEKNNPQITFLYIILLDDDKKAIAFASIQIIDFHLGEIENSLNEKFDKLKCFGRSIGIFPKLKPIKVLVCGNVFVSGEHGIFIKESQDKQKIIKDLAKAIRVHGNFAEYVPIALILLASYELNGASAMMLHVLGAALVVGRVLHVIGLTKTIGLSVQRQVGMLSTFFVILILAIENIRLFLIA